MQRQRDEAHRYAIGANRAKRAAVIGQKALDEIPNIGARRKRALLSAFGSARAVGEAGLDELTKVEGISEALAQKIYDYFR